MDKNLVIELFVCFIVFFKISFTFIIWFVLCTVFF